MATALALFIIFHATCTSVFSLNLTYGTLRFNETQSDAAVSFKTMKEYKLFLESNDLGDIEPGYLVKLIEANKNKYAACLDGSPQAFYYRPGYDDGVDKFNIYLQGLVIYKNKSDKHMKIIPHINKYIFRWWLVPRCRCRIMSSMWSIMCEQSTNFRSWYIIYWWAIFIFP